MAQEDTQGSGRTHQESDSPLLRQREQHLSGSCSTRGIEVQCHFIRERVLAGDVDLQHINANLQTTDIFTKALGADKRWQFMTDLGLTIIGLPSKKGSTEETTQ